MSVDYYLVCPEKKLIARLFTMNASGIWQLDKGNVFQLLLDAERQDILLLHEDDDRLPDCDDWENNWTDLTNSQVQS